MTDTKNVTVEQLIEVIRSAFADSANGVPAGNIIWKGCEAARYADANDATEAFLHAAATDVLNFLARHRQSKARIAAGVVEALRGLVAQRDLNPDRLLGALHLWDDARTALSSLGNVEAPAGDDVERLGLNIAERIREELTSGRQWWLDALSPKQREEFEAELSSTCVAVCEQEVAALSATRSEVGDVAKLREALTPSGETKAAYMGEFSWTEWLPDRDGVEQRHERVVPWTTIKEIMKAVRERAGADALDEADALAALSNGGQHG